MFAGCVSILFISINVGAPSVARAQNDPPRTTAAESSVRVDEADITTRSHFARAVEAAAAQQRDEAVDALLRAADADGDRLMPLPLDPRATWSDGFTVFIPVRRFAQTQLAEMAARDPALLRIYRRRVDATARRWFEEADQNADLAGLERVIESFLLSSWGDDALWRASELALERGQFVTARRALEQLNPRLRTPESETNEAQGAPDRPPAGRSWWLTMRAAGRLDQSGIPESPDNQDAGPSSAPAHWLAYPDAERTPADSEARAVLVSILAGERTRAAWELQRFRRRQPEAAGQLNGRQGRWGELLSDWLAASEKWPLPLGSSGRTEARVAPPLPPGAGLEFELAARPTWTAALKPWISSGEAAAGTSDAAIVVGARTRSDRERRASLTASRPLIMGRHVIIQDATGIKAFDARTGVAAFAGANETGLVFAAAVLPEWVNGAAGRLFGTPRFALTSHDARVWARVGRPAFGAEPPVGIDAHPSRIVELDMSAEGKVVREVDLPTDADSVRAHSASDVWAGPPVYHDGRLFAVLRRGDGIESQCHVVCYDASTGRTIWRRFVAAADAARPRRSVDWHNGILAVHEGRLLVDTQLGAIAAISARNGVIEWLTRYPRPPAERDLLDDDSRFRRRALTSCLVHDDLVVVMTPDFPRPFALDVSTGQVVWVTSGPVPGDAVHLIGVGGDRLIVSGDSLYWFDIGTGKSRGQYPPAGTVARGLARPGPHGLGRGLLAGANVWWPTEDGILVFRQETTLDESGGWSPSAVREIPLAPRGASGGNLVLADGMLYIAGADKLYAFADAAGLARSSDAATDNDGRIDGRPASR